MRPNLLILGGTSEASTLARRVAQMDVDAKLSYAGRVANPLAQPIPVRSGGFGGVKGLAAYMQDHGVTHLVDATHPFAAQISTNACMASRAADVRMCALQRAPWVAGAGDDWTHVTDMQSAAQTLGNPPKNVFLGIGRQDVTIFTLAPHHRYLLRVVDPPDAAFPLPNYDVIVARGPFDLAGDLDLLAGHKIDIVVSKNAGGTGARAKIDAARALGLPVVMIDRPTMPPRREVSSVDAEIDWLSHSGTERGV